MSFFTGAIVGLVVGTAAGWYLYSKFGAKVLAAEAALTKK